MCGKPLGICALKSVKSESITVKEFFLKGFVNKRKKKKVLIYRDP